MIGLREALINKSNIKNIKIASNRSILVYPTGDDFDRCHKLCPKYCDDYCFNAYFGDVHLYVFDYKEFDTIIDLVKVPTSEVYIADMSKEKAMKFLKMHKIRPHWKEDMSSIGKKII